MFAVQRFEHIQYIEHVFATSDLPDKADTLDGFVFFNRSFFNRAFFNGAGGAGSDDLYFVQVNTVTYIPYLTFRHAEALNIQTQLF